MKFYSLILVFIGIGMGPLTHAQEVISLNEVLGADKFSILQENYPDEVDFLTYYNRFGYYVTDMPEDKEIPGLRSMEGLVKTNPNLPDLSSELVNSGDLNIMGYTFAFREDRNSYYTLPDGRLLVILSLSQSRNKYNNITD